MYLKVPWHRVSNSPLLVACLHFLSKHIPPSHGPACVDSSCWSLQYGICSCNHRHVAKYRLRHVVRTILTDDEAFEAVARREDAMGRYGIFLFGKSAARVARRILLKTFRRLGPLILPLRELVRTGATIKLETSSVHLQSGCGGTGEGCWN